MIIIIIGGGIRDPVLAENAQSFPYPRALKSRYKHIRTYITLLESGKKKKPILSINNIYLRNIGKITIIYKKYIDTYLYNKENL